MLTDTDSKKNKTANKQKSIVVQSGKQWSDKQKIEAIQSYLLLGNMALTSRILGIPEITLKVWKTTEWWKDKVHEIKTQDRIVLSSRMKKIVDASLSVVEDRLVNGDFQFDQKSGQVIRKPVNMKDAHKVAVDLQDRQEILEKTDVPELSDEGVESRLLKLADKFAEMATKKIEQQALEKRTLVVEDARVIEEYK